MGNRFPNDVTNAVSMVAACLGALLLSGALALAQENSAQSPRPAGEPGLFGGITRWFGEQASKFNSNFKDARWQVENFGREAGIAAKTTASGARDAADAVAKFSGARIIRAHQKCHDAPNGAPDCLAAATNICQAAGFETGKSVDMTTSEICPPEFYRPGRNKTNVSCRYETFVSRVLCQ